jgi:hypothetical protein
MRPAVLPGLIHSVSGEATFASSRRDQDLIQRPLGGVPGARLEDDPRSMFVRRASPDVRAAVRLVEEQAIVTISRRAGRSAESRCRKS